MATRVTEANLPCLLSALADRLPQSMMVHGTLKSYVEGRWPGQSFWVDQWPHFKVVIATPIRGQTKTAYADRLHYVYSSDATALRSMLRNPDVIDWSKILEFEAPFEDADREMAAVAKEKGLSGDGPSGIEVATADPEHLVRLPIPEDMVASPITADDVNHITKTWEFSTADSPPMVQAWVDRFPSLLLRDRSGERVGHGITYSFGQVGIIYVEPKFRGRGIGKVILSQLSQEILAQGWPLFTCIEEGNAASWAMHRAVGYRRCPAGTVSWMVYNGPKDHFRSLPERYARRDV